MHSISCHLHRLAKVSMQSQNWTSATKNRSKYFQSRCSVSFLLLFCLNTCSPLFFMFPIVEFVFTEVTILCKISVVYFYMLVFTVNVNTNSCDKKKRDNMEVSDKNFSHNVELNRVEFCSPPPLVPWFLKALVCGKVSAWLVTQLSNQQFREGFVFMWL